jgi:hypothetical protein
MRACPRVGRLGQGRKLDRGLNPNMVWSSSADSSIAAAGPTTPPLPQPPVAVKLFLRQYTSHPTTDTLTPQELRAALIIADGATIQEAAIQLFPQPEDDRRAPRPRLPQTRRPQPRSTRHHDRPPRNDRRITVSSSAGANALTARTRKASLRTIHNLCSIMRIMTIYPLSKHCESAIIRVPC